MYKTAIAYWMEHPVVGIGLGSYRWRSQEEKISLHSYHIHNTGIWLLTEMGLVGLLLFSGFFLVLFITLVSKRKNADALSIGVTGVLLVMIGASAGTEILYQRYLWFLLGMALVFHEGKQA